MLFNSFTFLVFFLITFFLYYIPQLRKQQVLILIVASFIFYAWSLPILLFLLVFSILINFATSFKVSNTPRSSKRNRVGWAFLGVAANLSILALFKYGSLLTNLFLQAFNISDFPEESIITFIINLPLPIGISFYTFQGISLVIDVLREQENDPEETQSIQTQKEGGNSQFNSIKNYLFNTAFFISFFPQLIAGPIVKAHDFFPQIQAKYFRDIPWDIVFRSLVIGYFLKMVVADNLKDYTFWLTFPYYQGLGTVTILVLLFGYSMQIFADFAGYSLIAIGLAASLGYTLPENFKFPYISRSLSEFWTRWHISLSTWLKSYLYIPLGGNRKGKYRTYLNLLIVMTLGGLWHGAAWSYAVWGIYHGIGLALERFFNLNQKFKYDNESISIGQKFILDSIGVISVFSFVSLGWMLFKFPRFEEALDLLITIFRNIEGEPGWSHIIPVLIFSLPVVLYHIPHFPTFQNKYNKFTPKIFFGKIWQDVALGLMLFGILINSGNSNAFIYFQF
ncbi:MAG: MBOAT family O-acyltransferase [Coleofasciculus sp. A1-SPW-01]|uniref:MBOAT family O-acyltransferase n=1 Tax=Coleofasciculus sp. A1-SPW-01 TaxID=3070819 RepID=UPI0032F5CA20